MQHADPTRALAAMLAGLLMDRGDGGLAAWAQPEARFRAAPAGLDAGGAVSVDFAAGGLGAGGDAAAAPGAAPPPPGEIGDKIWACVEQAGEQWGGEPSDPEWKELKYVLSSAENRRRLAAFLDFDAGCAARLADVMHTQRRPAGLDKNTRRALCELCVVLQGVGVPSVARENGLYGAETAPQLLRRRSWELLGALLTRQCNYAVWPKPMKNCGAICYLNAVVACMLSCRTFVAYLWTLQGILEENLTEYVPATLATEVGTALAGATDCMYSDRADTVREPLINGAINMPKVFNTILPKLMGGHIGLQQDVHECYMFMTAGRAPRQSEDSPGNEIAGEPGLLSRNTMLTASVVTTFVHQTEYSGCEKEAHNRKIINKQAILANMFLWSSTHDHSSYTRMINYNRTDGERDKCDECDFHSNEYELHQVSVFDVNDKFDEFKKEQMQIISNFDKNANNPGSDPGEIKLRINLLKLGILERQKQQKAEIEQLKVKYRSENPLKITATEFFAFPAPTVFIVHVQRTMNEGGPEQFRRDDEFHVEEYMYVVAKSDPQYYTLTATHDNNPDVPRYRACGMACHCGSQTYIGHYISYVRRTIDAKTRWFRVDDSQAVVESEFKHVVAEVSKNVCTVFYELETGR